MFWLIRENICEVGINLCYVCEIVWSIVADNLRNAAGSGFIMARQASCYVTYFFFSFLLANVAIGLATELEWIRQVPRSLSCQ